MTGVVLETWYKYFCKRYQRLLQMIIFDGDKRGSYWVSVPYFNSCDCSVCNTAHRWFQDIYHIDGNTRRPTSMFTSHWDDCLWFNENDLDGNIVWVPMDEEVQMAVKDYGISLSLKESLANNLYAKLEVLLSHPEKLCLPPEEEIMRKAALKELEGKGEYLCDDPKPEEV